MGEGVFGGWIPEPSGPAFARLRGIAHRGVVEAVPAELLVPGAHQKQNLLAAALALLDLGLPADFVRAGLGRFPGVAHRLEFFRESNGIRFYDDTTATIPEAAAAAIAAFNNPADSDKKLILVTGGTDKDLDFAPLAAAAVNAKAIILLAGTGTDKLKTLLDGSGVKYRGPFGSLEPAVQAALNAAAPGDTVVLSPGCTSFGMFTNEFDRGRKWKEAVRRLI